jgi:hypothetical protein
MLVYYGALGSGEPAAPRRQSLLRSQARYALLSAATPRMMGASRGLYLFERSTPTGCYARHRLRNRLRRGEALEGGSARTRGVAPEVSVQRAGERSSERGRGAAGSPDT